MAREVYRFAVTVPAGTLRAAPQISPLVMPSRVISRVEIKVPPGPHGLLGFQLGSGGLAMVPVNPGQFLTPDGETLDWSLEDQITSGAWQMIAYNTGAFDHTLELRFFAAPVPLLGVNSIPAAIDPTLLLG